MISIWRCPACGTFLRVTAGTFTRAYCGCTVSAAGRGTVMILYREDEDVVDCGDYLLRVGPWQ